MTLRGVALPEDVNALYPFSSEIFYLSILAQQKVFWEPIDIVFPLLESYTKAGETLRDKWVKTFHIKF